MKSKHAITALILMFGTATATFLWLRSVSEGRAAQDRRPRSAVKVDARGAEATRPVPTLEAPVATDLGHCGGSPARRAESPLVTPPESLVPQPVSGPDRGKVDGAPLRERLLAVVRTGTPAEIEACVNATSLEEVAAALEGDGTARLEGLFSSLSKEKRLLVAWVLSHSPEASASDFLAGQLRSEPDPEVRQALVMALQVRPDGAASRGLRFALASDPDGTVRATAAYAIGDRTGRDTESLLALIGALGNDGAVDVRAAAATGLGLSRGQEAAQALVGALDSPSSDVRFAAARALGAQEGFASADALAERARTEPDAGVRAALEESRLALRGELTIDKVGGCTGH